jgi:hypothetical protein
MPTTIIYTVITGNYDTIKQPLVQLETMLNQQNISAIVELSEISG